jgi:hypothetical protein
MKCVPKKGSVPEPISKIHLVIETGVMGPATEGSSMPPRVSEASSAGGGGAGTCRPWCVKRSGIIVSNAHACVRLSFVHSRLFM